MKKKEKISEAQSIWEISCSPIKTPHVKEYFRHRNVLSDELPNNVRFDVCNNAIICAFKNDVGEVVGVHRTFVDSSFRNKKLSGRNYKQALGLCSSFIELYSSSSDIAVIAEGLEATMAGRKLLGDNYTFFMAYSAYVLRTAEFPEARFKKVIILADNDEAGISAASEFRKKLTIDVEVLTAKCDWDELKELEKETV